MAWVLTVDIGQIMGAVVKSSVFLIGFGFFQRKAFHRRIPQVYLVPVLSITKVQAVSSLRNQHIFFFSFSPHHKAAEQAARIGAHEFPVVLEEGVFRGDVLRELFKILFAQNDDLRHFKCAGDVAYLVPAQAVQRFGVCRKCGVLLFYQYLHLSFLE